MAEPSPTAQKSASKKKRAALRNLIAGRGCYRFQKTTKGAFYHVEDRGKGKPVYDAFAALEEEIVKQRETHEEQLAGLKHARIEQPASAPVEKLTYAQLRAIVEARSFYTGPVRAEARTLAPSLDANPLLLSEAVIGDESVEVVFPDGVSMRYPKDHPLAAKLVAVQGRLKEAGIDLEEEKDIPINAPGIESIAEEKTKDRGAEKGAPPPAGKPAPDLNSGEAKAASTDAPASLRTALGTLVAFGEAPYKDDPNNKMSPFIELEDEDGHRRKEWGVDFPRALEESGAKVGERVSAELLGKQWVTIKTTEKDEKGKAHIITKDVQRNAWRITPLDRERGTVEQAGPHGEPSADTPNSDVDSSNEAQTPSAPNAAANESIAAVLSDWYSFVENTEEFVPVRGEDGPDGATWHDVKQSVPRRFFAGKANGVDTKFPVTDITRARVAAEGILVTRRDGTVLAVGQSRPGVDPVDADPSLLLAGYRETDVRTGKHVGTQHSFDLPVLVGATLSSEGAGAFHIDGAIAKDAVRMDEKTNQITSDKRHDFESRKIAKIHHAHGGFVVELAGGDSDSVRNVFVVASQKLARDLTRAEQAFKAIEAPAPSTGSVSGPVEQTVSDREESAPTAASSKLAPESPDQDSPALAVGAPSPAPTTGEPPLAEDSGVSAPEKAVPRSLNGHLVLNERTPDGRFPSFTIIHENGEKEVQCFPEEIAAVLEDKCVAGPISVHLAEKDGQMLPDFVNIGPREVPIEELVRDRREYMKKHGRAPVALPRIEAVDIGDAVEPDREIGD